MTTIFRFLLVAFACAALSFEASAQIRNTWKGGAPGHETDWNFYKNWSLGKAPDLFHNVVIPDVSTSTQHYPVLKSGSAEVASLEIQQGATLTLQANARLRTTEFTTFGTCEGCSQRLWVEGQQSTAAVQAAQGRQ